MGMLGLTFANPADYDKIQEDDTFDILVSDFAPGKQIKVIVHHSDGSSDAFMTNHTYNQAQIDWFNEGSALNLIRKQEAN